MEEQVLSYLYQPNVVLEIVILLAILISFRKPAWLTGLVAMLLLVRPNERFACIVSYPKLIFPVLALALVLFSSRDLLRRQLALDRPLLLFLLFIVLQTIFLHPGDLGANLEFLILGALFYYAVLLLAPDADGAACVAWATVAGCFLICAEAAYYHYTEPAGSLIWNYFHTPHSGRLQAWGNWRNANETAFIACIGVGNLTFLWLRYRTRAAFWASLGLIPFFALVVFLTASRAGLASLLLIFLPMVLLLEIKGARVAVVAVLVAAVVLAGSLAPEREDREASTADRMDLRYRGVHLFMEYPVLGVGFQRARREFGGQPLHNTYLQALTETGVVGAPFLFYYLFALGRRIYLAMGVCRREMLPRGNVALIAGVYLSATFYFMWANQLLSLLFFLIMAQVTLGLRLLEADHEEMAADEFILADSPEELPE